jgi:hypothetical protein
MTPRILESLKPLLCLRPLALLLLLIGVGGCSSEWQIWTFGMDVPTVRGTWKGHIRATTVVNAEGKNFDAAEFGIDEGPGFSRELTLFGGDPQSFVGGGWVPLLVRYDDGNNVIIDPRELPVGKLVEIRGIMYVDAPSPPPDKFHGYGPGVYRTVPKPLTNDQLIILYGKPRVL